MFPKVTICPNGMHSIKKLTKEYKDLNRMAYGELYKGTFKKYRNTKNKQLDLSENMQARDLKFLQFFLFKSSIGGSLIKATLNKMKEIKFEDFFNKTFSEIKGGLKCSRSHPVTD